MLNPNIRFLRLVVHRRRLRQRNAGARGWRHLCLLLQSLLLLQQTDLVALLQCELRVLAINALAVDRVARLLYLGKNLEQVFDVNLARADQSKQKCFMSGVHLVKLKFKQQTLGTIERL